MIQLVASLMNFNVHLCSIITIVISKNVSTMDMSELQWKVYNSIGVL